METAETCGIEARVCVSVSKSSAAEGQTNLDEDLISGRLGDVDGLDLCLLAFYGYDCLHLRGCHVE